ncbi:STAS domain-containing protein [Streptomyces sp. BH105]|uniref:STAS domain-containing protein n=1 Tax=Streptomyces sp. BH105 TaxID=3410408 RepID=UPI003CF9D279
MTERSCAGSPVGGHTDTVFAAKERGSAAGIDPDQRGRGLRLTLTRAPAAPGHVVILTLAGELDTGSIPALCELISQALGEGSRHLIMELSGVTRCDNASFFTLLGVRQAAHHAAGSLTLANPSPCVRLALSYSLLRDLLPCHDLGAPERPGAPARSGTSRDHRDR